MAPTRPRDTGRHTGRHIRRHTACVLRATHVRCGQLPGTDLFGKIQPPKWWAWKDLNFRPHAYQARALTN